jgi:hypothetical protein
MPGPDDEDHRAEQDEGLDPSGPGHEATRDDRGGEHPDHERHSEQTHPGRAVAPGELEVQGQEEADAVHGGAGLEARDDGDGGGPFPHDPQRRHGLRSPRLALNQAALRLVTQRGLDRATVEAIADAAVGPPKNLLDRPAPRGRSPN